MSTNSKHYPHGRVASGRPPSSTSFVQPIVAYRHPFRTLLLVITLLLAAFLLLQTGVPSLYADDASGDGAMPVVYRHLDADDSPDAQASESRLTLSRVVPDTGDIRTITHSVISGDSPGSETPDSRVSTLPAANMSVVRGLHTATRLADGRVLVVGGYDENWDAQASAELYDPTTDSWSPANSLLQARYGHTATVLDDGRVLIAGGEYILWEDDGYGYIYHATKAEIYDPATGAWSVGGDLNFPRTDHTATLLPDGNVLITGGFEVTWEAIPSAELYDPDTNTWTSVTSLTDARANHTATLLSDGKVLVAGGVQAGYTSSILSSTELYDPALHTWTSVASLAEARTNHTAVRLPDDSVLVMGGAAGNYGAPSQASTERYDPTTDSWVSAGDMTNARTDHTTALLPDGRVLVLGGYDGSQYLSGVEVYDLNAGWSIASGLSSARGEHTATVLDGVILVTGGRNNSGYLSSAELYDFLPQWSAAASLAEDRFDHTATLLQNGRVLVLGGYGEIGGFDGPLAQAELFDPATNLWSAAGTPTARASHSATLLPDGRVLVAGGAGTSGYLSSAQLYDPASNSWTDAASMTQIRIAHTATLLTDGRVLVAGGYNDTGAITGAELYDPDNDAWSSVDSLSVARSVHTATVLPDGRVLVIGGADSEYQPLNSVVLFDPTDGSWSDLGSLLVARFSHITTLLPDGRVLVAGGLGVDDDGSTLISLDSAELFDPANPTAGWNFTDAMSTTRDYHTATLLPNGRVLVTGGENSPWTPLSSAELYDPATDTWSAAPSLLAARWGHTTTLLPDGRVLAVAGWGDVARLASAELYDPAIDSWLAAPDFPGSRQFHTATLLPNGRVMIAGGNEYFGPALSTVMLYDAATNTWSAAANMLGARTSHTATLLPDGRALVVGGSANNLPLTSAEMYDPTTNSWTAVAPMSVARQLHTATLLADGRVLVVGGGSAGNSFLLSAEVYDPATNSWTAVASMNATRRRHTATLLTDGRVLVVGGAYTVGNTHNSAELYDPINNTWTYTTNNLTTSRANHTATLLPDGRVMVTGGQIAYHEYLTSTEIYNPVTGLWSVSDDLNTGRRTHTATLLPNGRVLVIGGNYTSITEMFDPATNQWVTVAGAGGDRQSHTATLLPNGRVLAVGGIWVGADLYDPGLGFDEAWRPQINAVNNLLPGGVLTLSGQQFRGVGEASGGAYNNSASDYPLVQLRSLVNEQMIWLRPANGLGWSDTHFTSVAIGNFPIGPALVTVFTNGIPSQSAYLRLARIAVWDNGSGDGLWSNRLNWDVDEMPTGVDTAVFNTTSTADALVDPAFGGYIYEIQVNEGYTGTISLGRSLTITTDLLVQDGVFAVDDLPVGGPIALDGAFAVNDETPNLTIGGSAHHIGGVIQETRPVGVGSATFLQIEDAMGNVRYRGVEVDTTSTGTDAGNVTVRIRSLEPGEYCTSTGATSPMYANRCFEIIVSGENGPADLTLYAPTDALNGIAEENLAVYRYEDNPLAWTELDSTTGNVDGLFTYATARTSGFSYFLLGETGHAPTAVTLQSLSAGSQPLPLAMVGLGLLALAWLSWVIWRRRRPVL